ncbi:MAG: hypothetical protein R3Y44_01505 [Rikenellaceae bacterium]
MKRAYLTYIILIALSALTPQIALAAEPQATDSLTTDAKYIQKIDQSAFINKGEMMLGLTASYGSLSSDNSALLYLLNGVDAALTYASINPFIGCFYTDNRCVGVRLGYSTIDGVVDSAAIDLGASNDIALDVPNMHLNSRTFEYSIFHRSYLGLDSKGTFGLFAEFELMAQNGKNNISYEISGVQDHTHNESFGLSLGFNPGISVFVLDNVSTNVSFGFGGLGYNKITQYDSEGNMSGSRATSQLRLKFNITDINFGITVHL